MLASIRCAWSSLWMLPVSARIFCCIHSHTSGAGRRISQDDSIRPAGGTGLLMIHLRLEMLIGSRYWLWEIYTRFRYARSVHRR
ncbi:hypothetical protein D3C77_529140 [compost metagenome]